MNSSESAAPLKRLCNRLKRQYGALADISAGDTTMEMLLACLASRTTESQAHTALNRLKHTFVDLNEMRVARIEDVAEVLGKNFPQAREAAVQMVGLLREIYDLRDSLDLNELIDLGKREAKTFLQNLQRTSEYMVARVMLNSLDAHAFPVDEQLMAMLRSEGLIDEKATPAEVQTFMERQIPARQIKKTFALLTRYASDVATGKAPAPGDEAKAKKKAVNKPAPAAKKKPTTKKKTS